MAKITAVTLNEVPETINVGDQINDIDVNIQIEYHRQDILLSMEYLLHVFVYDINGKMDIPVIISNWDDSMVLAISEDGRKDNFLGRAAIAVKATETAQKYQVPLALKLGISHGTSYFSKKLEVFATLIPAVGRASKWSEPFETRLIH